MEIPPLDELLAAKEGEGVERARCMLLDRHGTPAESTPGNINYSNEKFAFLFIRHTMLTGRCY